MQLLFELSFLILSLTVVHCYVPRITGIYEDNTFDLANEYLTVQFNLSNGQILSFNYKSQIVTIVNEISTVYLDNQPVDCSKLLDYKQDTNSINFTYSCPKEINCQFTSIYTLKSKWEFVQKQIYITNIENKTITSLQTTFTITNRNISSVSIIQNRQDTNRQHTIFLRTNFTSLGIFSTWQNPFGAYSVNSNNLTMTSSHSVGMYAPFLSDGFLIGFYQLSPYWHIPDINYAEREAYEKSTRFFLTVPQREQSLKHAAGWDSNDYQIDISTQHGIDQYKRLIDRCSQLGIKSINFSPSNNNVSNRQNSTDVWGWESTLFITLGQKIRLDQWKPIRDPLPVSIAQMLDYARSKQVKLVAYVYPQLGYRSKGIDQAWLYSSSNCKDMCASLASVEFQKYFLQLAIDFAQVTGQ